MLSRAIPVRAMSSGDLMELIWARTRADINVGLAGSNPMYLTPHNPSGRIFFSADGEDTGFELWRSDGSQAGTELILDIHPGSHHSNPSWIVLADPSAAQPLLFFGATDGQYGNGVWKSDGEVYTSGDGSGSGTSMVCDIYLGRQESNPSWLTMLSTSIVLFAADDGIHGNELWSSNGASCSMVKDIWPGSKSSSPSHLVFYSGKVYFAANDGSRGVEFWGSDGTTGGTSLIYDACTGTCSSSPAYFAVFHPTTIFTVGGAFFSLQILALVGRSFGDPMAPVVVHDEPSSIQWPTLILMMHPI